MLGLPGLDPRGGEGAIFNAAFGVVFPFARGPCVPRTGGTPRLPTGSGLVIGAVVSAIAAPLWCERVLQEGMRAGLEGDGGRCRGRRGPSQRWNWNYPFFEKIRWKNCG